MIRHGETDFNRRGIVQGSGVDSDLNSLGQAQAKAFYEAYQAVAFDKIYVSALKRTHQSVAGFVGKNIPCEIHAGLNEISWGIREGLIPNYTDNAYYKMLVGRWRSGDLAFPADGGESPLDVQARQQPVVNLMLARPAEKTILVAMHGRAMRVLLATLTKKPLELMDYFEHSNLGLYVLQYSYEDQTYSIQKHNDVAHLQKLDPQNLLID